MCLYLWPRTQEVRVDCELFGVTPGSCICFTLEAVLEGAAQVKPDRLENQIGGSRFFRVCQNDFKSRSVRVALLWEFQIGLITRSGASSRSKRLPDRIFYIFLCQIAIYSRSCVFPRSAPNPDRVGNALGFAHIVTLLWSCPFNPDRFVFQIDHDDMWVSFLVRFASELFRQIEIRQIGLFYWAVARSIPKPDRCQIGLARSMPDHFRSARTSE